MKIGSNNTSGGRCLTVVVGVMVTLSVGGCGDFTTPETAAVESTRIIKDLGRVDPRPDPNVPLPHFFTAPPKIIEQNVGGNLEYKLFYFCQHHTSPELQTIVHNQFASALFDEKGKSTRVADYNVSSNAATNQLIVRCPMREDAESVLDFLREADVPPIQVKISCLISEVYADKTIDWETTLAIQDLFGEGLTAVPSGQAFGTAIPNILEEPSTIAAFPGGSLRELARAKMGLKVGYLSHSGNFLSMVDTLESQGYLKILMNPTLEIINGKQAKVMSSQKVPVQTTYLRSGNSELFESRQEYEDVIDSLTITPHVFADGYIGIETSILLGSKLTPEGIKQIPIITKKQIENKENRIRPGESLVIGGLRKSERRDVLRGVPFLKDIPILGILFSGRDFEERAVETIFILTPTISTGGVPREEMVDDVKRRHGAATSDDEDSGLDLFGAKKARAKADERKVEEAEAARLEAEAEKAIARNATREAEDRIEKAESEADAKAKAADAAKATADKAIADAAVMQAAKAEADAKIKAAADHAAAEAEKIIGGPSSGPGEEGDGAAKAEEPAPDGEKPIDEAPKTDPNRPVPAKGDEAGDAVVAKDKPEATPKSTPLDAPRVNDAIAKPASDGNKSMLEGGGDGALEKPTAKQVDESPEQNKQTPMKSLGEVGQEKVCEAFSSTEKGETKIGKADASKPEVVSKQGQGQAEKAKPVAEDPRMRMLMLVLSALSL